MFLNKKNEIDVSVMIITHNRGPLLKKAIKSALNQKNINLEIIVIDDNSTDNTSDIVKDFFNDYRFRYFKISKAPSISFVRNKALKYVRGKYVAVLDSDDVWCDKLKLLKQFNFLESNKKYVLVGTWAILINKNGDYVKDIEKPVSDKDIRSDILTKNPFFHSSVMYSYSSIKKVNFYNENIFFGEDFDLFLKLGKIGKLYNLPEKSIKYRVHDDNESVKHKSRAILDVLRVINKYRKTYNFSVFIFFKKIFFKLLEKLKR